MCIELDGAGVHVKRIFAFVAVDQKWDLDADPGGRRRSGRSAASEFLILADSASFKALKILLKALWGEVESRHQEYAKMIPRLTHFGDEAASI